MFRLSTARYGRLLLIVTLLLGFYNLLVETGPVGTSYLVGDKLSKVPFELGAPVSAAYWLPTDWVVSSWLPKILLAGYVVGAFLWLFHWGVPWVGWLTTICYTLGASVYLQTQTHVGHSFQLANQILVILALWYTFYGKRIKQGELSFPSWVLELSVLAVAVFYGLAGLNKVWYHGLDWFGGLNMQLFVHLFGQRDSVVCQSILESRSLAVWGQVFTVMVEIGALLALFPRFRILVGLGLTALHAGIWLVFGWPFLANTVLIVLLLFPFYDRLDGKSSLAP